MSVVKPIKNLIFQYFKFVGLEEPFGQHLALAYWDKAVGKEIARHTEPFRVKDGVIYVKVDNDAWRNELQFFKHEIVDKLNANLGKTVIKEIKFY